MKFGGVKYCLAAVAMVVAVGAWASDGIRAEADTVRNLAEVEVTAIKSHATGGRDRAATVLAAPVLERYDVASMKQVSEMVPNFYVPQYGSQITSSIYVRGLGARIDQPAVGLSVDNVALLNKNNYDFDMADIEKVEVVRGPQNILFGRNTMAGQVNITTLSPMRFQGLRLMAEYGSGNTGKLSAGVYGKLLPRLAMSVSLYGVTTDGFHRNTLNNSRVGAQRQVSARWRTVWAPSGSVVVENTATFAWARQSGYAYRSVDLDAIAYNDTCFYRRMAFTDGLTVKARIGEVRISSVSTAQWLLDNMTLDQDFLPQDYFTLSQRSREWGLTQDVAASWSRGPFSNVGGIYGFYRFTRMNAPVTFKDTGIAELIEANRNSVNPAYPVRWDSREFVLGSDFSLPLAGASVYDEASVRVGSFTLTAGARLDYERTEIRYRSHTATGYEVMDATGATEVPYLHTDVDIDDRGTLHKSTLALLPKFSVGYQMPQALGNVYATASKGMKSGGYNTQMFSDVLQQRLRATMGLSMLYDVDQIINYNPEKSWNYEVGAHLRLLGGRLTADAALFYIDVRDQQLTLFPDGTTTGRVMANAGHSRSRGVELSLTAAPNDHFAARFAYGFTDATFVNFNDGREDHSGNRVPYAPRHTLFVGADYTLRPAVRWVDTIDFSANCRAVGPIEWDEANTLRQPMYALLGASLTLRRADFSLCLWAENITQTRYSTFHFVSIGHAFLQQGEPRRFGATLRLSFRQPEP